MFLSIKRFQVLALAAACGLLIATAASAEGWYADRGAQHAGSSGSSAGAFEALARAGITGVTVTMLADGTAVLGGATSSAQADAAVRTIAALPNVRVVRDRTVRRDGFAGSQGYSGGNGYSSGGGHDSAGRHGSGYRQNRRYRADGGRGSGTGRLGYSYQPGQSAGDYQAGYREGLREAQKSRGFWGTLFGGPVAWGWGSGGGFGSSSSHGSSQSSSRYVMTNRTSDVRAHTQTFVTTEAIRPAALPYDSPAVSTLRRASRGGCGLGGRNAFCRGGVKNLAELQERFRSMRGDYQTVLREAGWAGDPQDLFDAVESGTLHETTFPKRTPFHWMALRKNGKPTVARDLAFDCELPGFVFEVASGGMCYSFAIPKVCCNLALLKSVPCPTGTGTQPTTRPGTRPTTRPATKPATRPHAKLKVTPSSDCLSRTFVIDASKSGVDNGRLDSVSVTMVHPDGRREKLNRARGNRWKLALAEPGNYRFHAVAHATDGSKSAPAKATADVRGCRPTCDITLSASQVWAGESITIDGSASAAQVGELSKMRVEVYGADGEAQDSFELDAPFEGQTTIKRPGHYVVKLVSVDSHGQSSTTCAASVDVMSRVGWFGGPVAGLERRWRGGEFEGDVSAPLVGGEVGVGYRLSENVEIAPVVGGVLNTRHNDNSSLYGDVELNLVGEKGFIGTGVGIYDITHSDTRDGTILAQAGLNLPFEIDQSPVQIYVQGRLFMDMLDNISNNYVVWTGLRFPFTNRRGSADK